jgi:hypothetical protein
MADIRRTQAAQQTAQATAAYRAAELGQGQQRIAQAGQTAAEKVREFGITSQKQSARDFISFYNANKNQNISADQWTQIAKGFGVNLTGLATHAPVKAPKLTSVAPGHTVIDSNGNVVYRAPAGPTSTRPVSVAPGHSLVDASGKVIFTAPAAPSTATSKQHFFKGGDGREYVATPGPAGTWTTKPLGPGKPGGGSTGQAAAFPNLTKAQVIHLRSGIANVFYGVPEQKDPTGKKVVRAALAPGDYNAAITEAVKAGYSRAGATKMANRFYMPGKRGRPGR